MLKWQNEPASDDSDDELDYYEDEFGLSDDYEGFEKIKHSRKSEEELAGNRKNFSFKHKKRPDKE